MSKSTCCFMVGLGLFGLAVFVPRPVAAAEIRFVPVSATGSYQLVAPDMIYLSQGGQRVLFEFDVAGWDPDQDGSTLLKTIQVATSIGSYGNPNSPSPLVFPHVICSTHTQCRTEFNNSFSVCDPNGVGFDHPTCTVDNSCCDPFYMDRSRPDWLAFERAAVWATDPLSSRIGISFDPGDEPQDTGVRRYVGSLVLEVPGNAFGEFTLKFRDNETFVHDQNPPGSNNVPVTLVPAKVFVGVRPQREYGRMARYLKIEEPVINGNSAIAVKLVSLHHPARPAPGSPYQPADFTAFEGEVRWLGAPANYSHTPATPLFTFEASRIVCEPYFTDTWPAWPDGILYAFGGEVIPDSIYHVKVLSPGCLDFDSCGGDPVVIATGRWGDVVPPFEAELLGTQPDLGDVSGMVDRFRNAFGAPTKTQTQLQPNVPDATQKVNFADISEAVNAFRGYAYPFPGPAPCP